MCEAPRSVWVVKGIDSETREVYLALLADTLDAAKSATANYVGSDEQLEWEHRNGIFDGQDYLVATYDGEEFHVYEEEVLADVRN